MTVKVFHLADEDFGFEVGKSVFALSTSLPDHRLVYFINQYWNACFVRSHVDHELWTGSMVSHHSLYNWYNEVLDLQWHLLSNAGKVQQGDVKAVANTLFDAPPARQKLFPKESKLDYVLMAGEIWEDPVQEKNLVDTLHKIPGVDNVRPWSPKTAAAREALHVQIDNP